MNNIVTEYEKILIGNKKQFSVKNFDYEPSVNERTALKVFQYAIEELLRWTPEEAAKLLSPAVVDKMGLTPLLTYIRFPSELTPEDAYYIVHLIYPDKVSYDFRNTVIQVYEEVLQEKRKYPKDYMYGAKGLVRSSICLQYALKKYKTFHSVKDMYKFFITRQGMEFLKKFKLIQLYKNFFPSALEFLHKSIPEALQSELYFHYYEFILRYKRAYGCLPPMNQDTCTPLIFQEPVYPEAQI